MASAFELQGNVAQQRCTASHPVPGTIILSKRCWVLLEFGLEFGDNKRLLQQFP
jgi:hypothetical protein